MPDVITPEERAAIDSAIAAGKARKIPAGQSAYETIFDPARNTVVTRVRATGAVLTGRDMMRGTITSEMARARRTRRAKPRATDPKVAARRAQVRALVAEGKTVPEIALRIGAHPERVREDLKALDLTAASVKARRAEQIEARRAEVKRLGLDGRTTEEIARAVGASVCTVKVDLRALGIDGQMRKVSRRRRARDTANARRREIAAMVRAGETDTVANLAARFDCAKIAIYKDIQALRAAGRLPEGWRPSRRQPGIAERRVRVAALVLEGRTTREIAAELGRSPRTITSDIAALRAAGRLADSSSFAEAA